ncbi:hypothetical protein PJF56_02920, partial [Roseofilum sp. BLCC_M91]
IFTGMYVWSNKLCPLATQVDLFLTKSPDRRCSVSNFRHATDAVQHFCDIPYRWRRLKTWLI